MWKVGTRKLTDKMKDEGFLEWIETDDETLVHHYDPENKRQTME